MRRTLSLALVISFFFLLTATAPLSVAPDNGLIERGISPRSVEDQLVELEARAKGAAKARAAPKPKGVSKPKAAAKANVAPRAKVQHAKQKAAKRQSPQKPKAHPAKKTPARKASRKQSVPKRPSSPVPHSRNKAPSAARARRGSVSNAKSPAHAHTPKKSVPKPKFQPRKEAKKPKQPKAPKQAKAKRVKVNQKTKTRPPARPVRAAPPQHPLSYGKTKTKVPNRFTKDQRRDAHAHQQKVATAKRKEKHEQRQAVLRATNRIRPSRPGQDKASQALRKQRVNKRKHAATQDKRCQIGRSRTRIPRVTPWGVTPNRDTA